MCPLEGCGRPLSRGAYLVIEGKIFLKGGLSWRASFSRERVDLFSGG